MNTSISSATPFSQDARNIAKTNDKKESLTMGEQVSEQAHAKKTDDVKISISATNKKQLNVAILESTLQYEGSVSSQPQALLLKTALEGINEALKTLGVEKTVEQNVDEGVDVSPEATAERIVNFSTNFFPLYLEQHPEMEEDEALTTFVDVISGGIDQGFSEAKDVLTGLNVLEGDIETNIEKTYQLVQQGLTDFIDSYDTKENEDNKDTILSE